ncbi:hypothetical protein DL897_06710 [Thermoflavimicrobium daqui]|uniref:Uncharacterized protein n=1 Tax=Thermoflavimicrobium daqui TaxID=2137476 RepID=A0A364K626_9BACL|nr:hypothetical protein DL897_06710 [Thermoflavimicrobium daqui]
MKKGSPLYIRLGHESEKADPKPLAAIDYSCFVFNMNNIKTRIIFNLIRVLFLGRAYIHIFF